MQAPERVAETLPVEPGRPEKREFEYERHGTRCPTANFEVGTGKIIPPTIGQTRTEGSKGILQSMATRRAFLADRSHRVRFAFVPKRTSWLDRAELWFGVLGRRVLRRGNFRSLEDQRSKVLEFTGYYNRTMAKPYRWTYTGRPLTG